MIADKLLQHLHKVKQTGKDRWMACCPAHDDKNPSLRITELPDKLLIKCFAECDSYSIVNAVGLELSDLFPNTTYKVDYRRPKPIPAKDILTALASDITFVGICASDMASGEVLKPEEVLLLFKIAGRIKVALRAGGIS